MAAKAKGSTKVARRSILKGGAVALGAALLPHAGSAAPGPLEQLRAEYLAHVEQFASKLEPRFASGELMPWDAGDERWEDVGLRGYDRTPNGKLQRLCWTVVPADDARAALILAVSPRTAEVLERERGPVDGIPDRFHAGTLRRGAAEVMAEDVLELARARGWMLAEVRHA